MVQEGAMRTASIGLFFCDDGGESEGLTSLIQLCIAACIITHNSATAIMGAITNALFSAYAITKTPINKWPFMLIEILKSRVIHKIYAEMQPGNQQEFDRDSMFFFVTMGKICGITFFWRYSKFKYKYHEKFCAALQIFIRKF